MLLIEYLWALVSRNDLKSLLGNCTSSDGYAVKIENGSFRWSNLEHDPLVLQKSAAESLSFIRDD